MTASLLLDLYIDRVKEENDDVLGEVRGRISNGADVNFGHGVSIEIRDMQSSDVVRLI